MSIGKINIPKIEIEPPYPRYHDYQTRIYLQYDDIVENSEMGRLVAEKLKQDSRVLSSIGRGISTGNSDTAFEVNKLAMWFLWCSNECGLDRAEAYLEAFLNSDTISVINTLWVAGIEVDEPIFLDNGYVINPLKNMPDSRDKEYFLQHKYGENFQENRAPACAITKNCSVKKVLDPSRPIEAVNDNKEYWEISWFLQDIALILNAINGVCCTPYFSTSYVVDAPFGPFAGSGGACPIYDVLPRRLTKLSLEANDINELTKMFFKMDGKAKEKMRQILDRLSQAKRRIKIEDQILDLGIALEMLLLDNSSKEQLTSRFRSRGSWLLGVNDEDRSKKKEQLNKFYGYRSRVVHSGTLGNKKYKASESFSEYLKIAEDICQKVIKDGEFPNWKKLSTQIQWLSDGANS